MRSSIRLRNRQGNCSRFAGTGHRPMRWVDDFEWMDSWGGCIPGPIWIVANKAAGASWRPLLCEQERGQPGRVDLLEREKTLYRFGFSRGEYSSNERVISRFRFSQGSEIRVPGGPQKFSSSIESFKSQRYPKGIGDHKTIPGLCGL